MKKPASIKTMLLSLAAAAVTALSVGANASAAAINYKWSYDVSSRVTDEHIGRGGKITKFSVDDKIHTDNSWYSIKLENTDYNVSYVERTYNVEPFTEYKFSAMVKYSGYQLDPAAKASASGACIGKAFSWSNSGYTASNEWTLMEYEFKTGNETTINLALQNGIYNGLCKGTAWFSDVKLEKAEMTNSWNILAVIIKNADVSVTMDGKQVTHVTSVNESQIDEVNKYVLDKLPNLLSDLSDNKLNVNSIDRYIVDETLTEKDLEVYTNGDINGYHINPNDSKTVSGILDTLLAKKHYNQIIVFAPLSGVNGGWWGLGGTQYKGVYFAQITFIHEGAFKNNDRFQGQVAVHEICHGLEHESKAINGDKTPTFHDILNDYSNQYPKSADVSRYERIRQFMTCTLPDGRGLDPSVFYRTSGKYTLVDDDMTTGAGITPGSSSVLPPAPANFRAESVSDTNIKFSWDNMPNADGYQFVRFKDANHKEMSKDPSEYKSGKTSATWGPFTKGKPLYYGIRAVYSKSGTTVYSDWTYLTYTHAGSGVVYGDVDNDGVFALADITAALRIIVNGTAVDQRTLSAACIGERTKFQLSDVTNLLKALVNS